MSFIDSHCHLDFPVLHNQLTKILQRAYHQKVTEFVVPSVCADNFCTVINLANTHSNIHFALGMHPCFMNQHQQQHLTLLSENIAKHNPSAVGEIGLDFFITCDNDAKSAQIELFNAQLTIAKQFKLPVLLHVRKAHDQVLSMLKKVGFEEGGIVHAFNGSAVQAKRYTQEFGFKLGFGGAITHPRATKLRALAAQLPLTDIVLETDAPDMPLVNMLETYNQPANISKIADILCELRHEPAREIAQQVALNTRSCLHLKEDFSR
ncbi:MAG: TatD DNase family protein [Oceanospirillaceae bacterium]|jgi:TatD DNase family protein